MNEQHLAGCASQLWADTVRDRVLPWAFRDFDTAELGDDVIEIGPGPGRTTEILRTMTASLTAVELDADLAARLSERMAGSNVTVVNQDATALAFADGRFSAGVCFTMLHHVPTAELQDQLLAELARVVRPGGWVVGSDSVGSDDLAGFHEGDTYNPIDPEALPDRLRRAGLVDVEVVTNEYAFRFRGRAT